MAGFGLVLMVAKSVCIDALPPGYVLKSQMKALFDEESEKITIEEEIENQYGLDTTVATGVASLDLPNFLRYHINHHTIEMITWEPWLESEVLEIEDVLTAKLLSRKRMPLQVPNGNCEYYLGGRCWMQLEGEARIPLDPPLNMLPHISTTAL
ncbi:hypothetical protein GIB67_002288 [Kingdonia uniflora]|uniref:Uncharacterized protein n=1 Tax=Kingdonia uniflora TaxID=39325 RepID=A0A7J7KX11_9MAGN|nr:hypothetical protein GIB67_002288 [Kingdonia uniflora]